MNCNKFYCNLTFYKLNTYLILTSAWFGFVEQNVSTDKYFLKEFSCRQVTPCLRMSAHAPYSLSTGNCREIFIVFLVPTKQIMRGGRVGLSL